MSRTIDEYLRGRLSAEEEEAFEAAYLGDRELLDELILAEKMQQGFKAIATGNDAAVSGAKLGSERRRFWATPQYAAAASVLLAASVVFSGLLYQDNQELRASSSSVQTPTRLVPLIAVRSASPIELAAPGADEWTVLLAEPGFTLYDDYEVVVSRAGAAEPVWQLDGMSRTYEDLLAIGMPGRLLTPGEYTVEISGSMRDWAADRAGESTGTLRLEVVAAP